MRLDRTWIENHIPHQGRMCLLDEVVEWDAQQISCRSGTHRAADHPLRAHGRLGAACGVEYAAQAMAVHGALVAGALTGGGTPAAGFLASLRGVQLHVLRLDDVRGDLICNAVRIAGDRATALYEFEVRSESASLMSGRATVVLDANERLHP
jgi:predicted hotdog family 3-hydroxylacyl-ACP dehydratase